MVVAYVVPATFGPALLRILGAPPFQLLVLQRATAAAIGLVAALSSEELGAHPVPCPLQTASLALFFKKGATSGLGISVNQFLGRL